MKTTLVNLLFFISFLFFSIYGNAQKIFINEIVSDNGSLNHDLQGDAPDWIELYNDEDYVVNLQNYSLSDDPLKPTKWIFPSKAIGPKNFIIVFASGKDSTFSQEEVHTNFKISSSGEQLFLYAPDGILVDKIAKVALERNQSFGRFPDGSSNFRKMDLPTPYKRNFESNSISPSVSSGFYADSFILELNSGKIEDTIYYTLNRSDPTVNDKIYTGPLMIGERSDQPNIFSDIPTTPPDTFNRFYWYWKPPERVTKATTIKFRSFRNSLPSSRVYHQTYFVGEEFENYSFPVFSLLIDSSALFDHDTGIYVPGAICDSLGFTRPWPEGNYFGEGPLWEREGHLQFFETDKKLKFETGLGIKMHGGGSLGLAQKGIRLLFKKKYGIGKLEYPIFQTQVPEDFQRLTLRAGGNTFTGVNFLEALLQDLLKNEDLDIQQYRPSVLFINGEYWGIHNIREKSDEHYINGHYDIATDQVLKRFTCGGVDIGWNPSQDFKKILEYLENNSLEFDSNYQYVNQFLDVENILTHYIMQTFYANKDMHNNMRYWGTKDGLTKWRTVVYDLDISFGFGWGDNEPSINHFEHSIQPICHTLVYRKLLENQQFRDRFVARSEEMLKTTFHSDTVINKFNEFKEVYRPHMQEHIDRWGYPESIEKWDEMIEGFKRYARLRPCYFKQQVEEFFGVDSLNFNCHDTVEVVSSNDFLYQNEQISIYPNPTSNVITLKTNKTISLKGNKLYISNLLGQKVYQKKIDSNQSVRTITLNHQSPGIYFLSIVDTKANILWRDNLIIER